MMKTFTRHQLSNEDYQKLPAAGGSALCVIHKDCEAVLKYAVRTENDKFGALDFGIASHACLMEDDVFQAEFVRGFDASQYPDALSTATQIKARIKDECGTVKGISKYDTKAKLIGLVHELDIKCQIIDVLQAKFEAEHHDKNIVPAKAYDEICMMRDQIMVDDTMRAYLTNAIIESSIVGRLPDAPFDTKSRPDIITPILANGKRGILNYKTTRDIRPLMFGADSYKNGYWLKEALSYDMYVAAYGEEPAFIGFLAQVKKPAGYDEYPYIWKPYYLEPWQLEVGRKQYQDALIKYARMMETGQAPAYGSNFAPIDVPQWVKNECFYKYGVEVPQGEE
jgi:hypothetical protein